MPAGRSGPAVVLGGCAANTLSDPRLRRGRACAVSNTSGPGAAWREARVAKALPKRCQNPGRRGARWANVGRAQSRRNARLPGIAADLLVRGRRGGLGRTVLARNTAKQGGRAGG